jgi:hypothetical protein
VRRLLHNGLRRRGLDHRRLSRLCLGGFLMQERIVVHLRRERIVVLVLVVRESVVVLVRDRVIVLVRKWVIVSLGLEVLREVCRLRLGDWSGTVASQEAAPRLSRRGILAAGLG